MSVTKDEQERNDAYYTEFFKKTAVLDEIRKEYAKYLDKKYPTAEALRLFRKLDKDYNQYNTKNFDPEKISLSTVIQAAYPALKKDKTGKPIDNRNQAMIDPVSAFEKEAESKEKKEPLTEEEREALAATKVFAALSSIETAKGRIKEKIAVIKDNLTGKEQEDAIQQVMLTFGGYCEELSKALKNHEAILKKAERAASPIGRMRNKLDDLIQFISERFKTKTNLKQQSPIILQHKRDKVARENYNFVNSFAEFFETMKSIDKSGAVQGSVAWNHYMEKLNGINRTALLLSKIQPNENSTKKEIMEFNKDVRELQERIEEAIYHFNSAFEKELKSSNAHKPGDLKFIQQRLGAGLLKLDKLQTKTSAPSENKFVEFFKKIIQQISKPFSTQKQKAKAEEKSLVFRNVSDIKELAKIRELQIGILALSIQKNLLVNFPKNIPEKMQAKFAELFNLKPKAAMLELQKLGVTKPEQIAHFLHTPGLDKIKLGEYLGELGASKDKGKNEADLRILSEFVKQFNFDKKELLPAMREYLDKFRLPGEAQKIERLVKCFAEEFYQKNEGSKSFLFNNSDAAYVLAYSVIMLNTDAHNPSIPKEKKMTEEQFINNNRGINDGKNFTPEFLKGIYKNIKDNEIKLKEEQEPKTVRYKR